MRMLTGVVGSIVTMWVLAGCGASTAPTAPTAAPVGPNGFGVIMATSAPPVTSFGACLSRSGMASCFSAARIRAGSVTASAATAPSAPLNFVATSSGSSVTLIWNAPSSGDPVTSYIIEAGSAPGLVNLANFSTGNALTIFQASGVGVGTYYVRVRGANAAGTGPASNEVALTVGGAGPCTAPGAPSGLTLTVNTGGVVSLAWNAASGTPTSYVVEAGSQPGLRDLVNSDLGSAATTLTATGVGAGTYYVRVRAKNPCGTSGASNEVSVLVGSAPPPGTFDVSPHSPNLGTEGGCSGGTLTTALTVTAAADVSWSVTPGSGGPPLWTYTVSPTSGTGSRTVILTVNVNPQGPTPGYSCSNTYSLAFGDLLVFLPSKGSSSNVHFVFTYLGVP